MTCNILSRTWVQILGVLSEVAVLIPTLAAGKQGWALLLAFL
jgi:hypothetical protein